MAQEKPFQINMAWDDDILTLEVSGQSYGLAAEEIASEVSRIEEENKARRVLVDVRKVVGRLGFSDTFAHVKGYHVVYKHVPDKTAVLDIEENEGAFTFHEMAARNAGFNIRFFTALEDALAWLKQ